MPVVNGTTYKDDTPTKVIDILEAARLNHVEDSYGRPVRGRLRLRLHYGDIKTGHPWGDSETGQIGRSTGTVKIPLLIKTRRSMGGGGILDNCIVKIEAMPERQVLYDITR